MPLNPAMNPGGAGGQDGGDSGPEFRDPRTTLGVEEMVSEEEARKRREQLNRRPSYRMILKDLETVGDKPLKRESDEQQQQHSSLNEGDDDDDGEQQSVNGGSGGQSCSTLQPLPDSSSDSPGFGSNGVVTGRLIGGNMPPKAPNGGPPNLPPGLCVGVSASNPAGVHLSSPAQTHLNLGQLNLIASARPQGRLIAEIPSQPQPQIQPNPPPQPLLAAVNNLEMLGLKAPDALSAAFSQNDWQNNLLNSYNRQPTHLLQNPSNSGLNNVQQQQQPPSGPHGGPPQHGLGTRQGSASLTSFTSHHRSDNDETSRKRQVRLLKNREAAKECRRKKKEYVKCLENRVAVLENQNKALIEELKTLKELYCRKEKGSDGQ